MAGKDVAFARFPFFAGGEDAVRDVADIDKIVTAFDAGAEAAGSGVDDELGEVAGFEIVGSDDAGGVDHRRVQPAVLDGFEDVAGGFGFGFGVFADDIFGIEIVDFGDFGVIWEFRQSVDAVDVDEFCSELKSFFDDVFRAEDVDLIDGGVGF